MGNSFDEKSYDPLNFKPSLIRRVVRIKIYADDVLHVAGSI